MLGADALATNCVIREATGSTVALVGMAFCIDEAASNQLASSDMPTLWALYLAAVALYYALICAFRWFRKSPLVNPPPIYYNIRSVLQGQMRFKE